MTPYRLQEAETLPRPRTVCTAALGGPPPGTVLCRIEDLAGADAVVLTFGSGSSAQGVFVMRHGESVVAYVNRCPHNGIPLNIHSNNFHNLTGERLLCVHHLARFRIDDGYCDAGPAEGHWLTPVAIEVLDGTVVAGRTPT